MRRAALFLLIWLLAPLTAHAAEDGSTTADGKLVLVLDSSGSMKERATGGTKIEAAKSALRDVVAQLPDDAEVGMRVFGATVFSADDKGACTDTQNVVPVGPLDREALVQQIGRYKPYGETPIGNALKAAAEDLGSEGQRTIVLMSDGEPTCKPDPCVVARDLRAQGVDLKVNVVGLSVSGKARRALQCIADAGGGTYYDVDSADDLASSLVSVSVRAFREFSLTGRPITGATRATSAEVVEPGQYTDTVPDQAVDRHYLVDVPKGGRVTAGVTARPETDGDFNQALGVELLTPDGQSCARASELRFNVLKTRSILANAVTYDPHVFLDKEYCDTASQMLVRVFWEGTATDVPFELSLRTYPRVINVATLPDGITETEPYEQPVRADGPGRPVVGGASFTDAPRLKTGTYADSIRPGEQLLYRVPVGWGQSARVSAVLEADPQADQVLGRPGVNTSITMFSPVREPLTQWSNSDTGVSRTKFYSGQEPEGLTTLTPPVRLKNGSLNDFTIEPSYLAGDYFVSVEMAGSLGGDGESFAAPLTLAVAVDGDVTGEPAYAGTPKDPARNTGDENTADGGWLPDLPWLWIGIGAGAVALAAGAFALGRRRS